MQILFTINLITWENQLSKDSLRTWGLSQSDSSVINVDTTCCSCTFLFTPRVGPCFVFYILYRNILLQTYFILLQTYFIYLYYNTTAIILFLQNFILFLHFLLPFHFHYFLAVLYFLSYTFYSLNSTSCFLPPCCVLCPFK